MKKIIVIAELVFMMLASLNGQENRIDDYLTTLYKTHVIPGFSVVVVKNDQISFVKGYGVEYAGGNKAMTSQTSTAIGSLTKSITALAIMQLVEKGKIELDAQVIKYLPWFHTANKEMSDKITVRMLLNNTSGLVAPTIRNKDISEKASEYLVRSMESVYLTLEPGSRYEYSNDGFKKAIC